jgi:hypothetical protein
MAKCTIDYDQEFLEKQYFVEWEDANILFKFPIKKRTDRVENILRNIHDFVDDKHNYQILLSADYDDESIYNCTFIERMRQIRKKERIRVVVSFSDNENKVQAINADINKTNISWRILVLVSDNTYFTAKGFDNIIRSSFAEHFPCGDALLHFPDDKFSSNLIVPVMDRKYYRNFMYVYNPIYKSNYGENELRDVAKISMKYKYIRRRIFVEEVCNPDSLSIYNETFNEFDKSTYNMRKLINFNLL